MITRTTADREKGIRFMNPTTDAISIAGQHADIMPTTGVHQ
jgi:hypothetical protein